MRSTLDVTAPDLSTGLTLLHSPGPRSGAFYRLVGDALADARGRVEWVDARNAASTYALRAVAPSRALDGVRVARAFTAYQHHELVRRVVRRVSPRTDLVVAPNVASLYTDDDVPGHEADRLLSSTLATLAELAAARSLPVLVTAGASGDDATATVAAHADAEIECAETPLGVAFEADGYRPRGYWREGYWQTTLPYWVDLLGVAPGSVGRPRPEPDLEPRPERDPGSRAATEG
jgi:hypothetical protein